MWKYFTWFFSPWRFWNAHGTQKESYYTENKLIFEGFGWGSEFVKQSSKNCIDGKWF